MQLPGEEQLLNRLFVMTIGVVAARRYACHYGGIPEATPPQCDPPWTVKSSSALHHHLQRNASTEREENVNSARFV